MDDKCRENSKNDRKKNLKLKLKKKTDCSTIEMSTNARFEHTINDNLYILVEEN